VDAGIEQLAQSLDDGESDALAAGAGGRRTDSDGSVGTCSNGVPPCSAPASSSRVVSRSTRTIAELERPLMPMPVSCTHSCQLRTVPT